MAEVKIKNTTAYSALVLGLSIQVVIILAVVLSFIPIKLNSFIMTLQPLYWDQVRPHRQLQLYAVFIVFGALAQAVGMVFLKDKFEEEGFARRLWPMVLMQWTWVLLESAAAFKIFVFSDPVWARWLLYFSLAGWALNNVFWPEFKSWLVRSSQWLAQTGNAHAARRGADISIVVVMLILLWPADMTKMLAHIFAWDNFFHLDYFVMSPGWAYLNGAVIDMDVNSNYNVMIPALLSMAAKSFGGFNYENVLRWIILLTLAYYVCVWAFLRYWFKSSLLAAFGFLLAIKLQMFHWGVLPVLWRYPSATPVRYLFDLLPILFIYKHSVSGRERYLWLASLASGLMMAFIMEVGIYLTLAFYAYLFMVLTLPAMRNKFFRGLGDIRKTILLGVLPFITALFFFRMIEGPDIWKGEFWANNFDYARLFINGFQSLPYWDGLKDKQFFAFCMGFVIPGTYVLTSMLIGALLYLGQIEAAAAFIIYVCIYGMGSYHYFVYRSAVTSYYVVCIPFVFVICFWMDRLLRPLPRKLKGLILAILVFLTFGALIFGYLFTVYPNVLNLAGMDLKGEVDFYNREFNFNQDARLIDSLTSPGEPVALISSYETGILMQADRKPFFYYFPMIYPEPMENIDFKGTELLTMARLQKTIGQLEDKKPAFVFIERKLFTGQLPLAYYQHYQALTILVRYLIQHYEPGPQGRWIMALKRK